MGNQVNAMVNHQIYPISLRGYSKILNFISISFFAVIVFFLTRQVPFTDYSYIMNFAVIGLLLINAVYIARHFYKNTTLGIIFALWVVVLAVLLLNSIWHENEFSLIIRFFTILLLLVSAYFIKPHKGFVSVFIFFMFFQALFLIGFEIYMIKNYLFSNYSEIRHLVNSNGWGDVYTYNGYFYKIQLKGNALLPFAFFVSMIYYSGKKRIFFSSVFLLSVILAGNFAFLLGVGAFIGLYFLYSRRFTINNILLYFLAVFLLSLPATLLMKDAIQDVVASKSIQSNPTRIDQATVLINNLSDSPVLGMGLGNLIQEKTQWRDYSNATYYELQALYFLNQIGVLAFALFILINILISIYFIKHKLLLLAYFSYIFYAFFNPYFLDTSHLAVIIVLISLRKVFDEKNIRNSSGLQSAV